jgi:tetratricopeptide (TPR) repeat protein
MRSLALLSLFVSLFVAAAAHAESQEARERAAKKACLLGDYSKGVELLTDLYVDTNNPIYIFNQGRCYEQNSRYEQAIGLFREFLRKVAETGKADQSDVASAERHVADCQALLAKQRAAAAPAPTYEPGQPSPGQPSSPNPDVSGALDRNEPVGSIEHSPTAGASGAGSALRTTGVVVTAVGAAALIAGVALNLKANSMVGDLQNRYSPSNDSSSKDYKTLSLVGYGVGIACVAGGAILYTFGWRAGHRVQVALVPSLTPNAAGAAVTGAF